VKETHARITPWRLRRAPSFTLLGPADYRPNRELAISVKQLDLRTQENVAVNDDAMQAKRARTANSFTLAKHHPWCL
jgi:hypothetical protein